MKKSIKKIISVALALCMCATGLVPSTASKAALSTQTINATLVTNAIDLAAIASATPIQVSLPGVSSGATSTTDLVVPVTVSAKGVAVLNYSIAGTTYGILCQAYADAGCTAAIGNSVYLTSTVLSYSVKVPVTAAGTIYVRVKYMSSVNATNTAIGINAYEYNGDDSTLSSNYQLTYTYDTSATATRYHMITVNSKSLVSISGCSIYSTGYSGLTVALCDANKIAISGSKYLSSSNSYTSQFVLDKGTYYVSSKESELYELKYTQVPVKAKAAKSVKKVKYQKKNKTVYGALTVGDKTSKKQVFKVKLKKRSKLKLRVVVNAGDTSVLTWKVTTKNGSKLIMNSGYLQTPGKVLRSTGKLKAGTYYLTITKHTATDCGYFAVTQK